MTLLRLHRKANAARWDISPARFGEALEQSARKALGEHAAPADVDRYLSGLHLEDLALACACADGHEGAWEHFVRELRPLLYRAADGIAGPDARELADSLYADLFGLDTRDCVRRSLFRYFHGRSRLATWLRSVLAQRYVDEYRSRRRQEPLPEEEGPRALAAPATPAYAGHDRRAGIELVGRALAAALAALTPRDRLRLGCYYAQELTLIEIGRITGESEATVSRRLARARKSIRAEAERWLRAEAGLADAAIAECLADAIDDPGPLDLGVLLGPDQAEGRASARLRQGSGGLAEARSAESARPDTDAGAPASRKESASFRSLNEVGMSSRPPHGMKAGRERAGASEPGERRGATGPHERACRGVRGGEAPRAFSEEEPS